jgi:predicted PurR-regulated permease PerM
VSAEIQKSRAYRETYGAAVKMLQNATTESLPAFADFAKDVFSRVFTFALQIVLSFVFSFMIVIGIPRFGQQFKSLESSRVANFYREIAPSVVSFGKSMGMAFQGQAIIAVVNTAMTIVGLLILGVPYPVAFGVIVFLCSFIPVLGVFLSSAPISLVALQEGGLLLAGEVVALVILIHIVEAYFLNPRILGSVMHMNPLLVLVILIVGEHFFGVWGLLLGVPLFHYVFNQVVLKKPLPEKPKRPSGEFPAAVTPPPEPPSGGHGTGRSGMERDSASRKS